MNISDMSLPEAKQHLLGLKQELDQTLALVPFFERLCQRNGIAADDPKIATPQKAPTPSLKACVATYDQSGQRLMVDHGIGAVRKALGWRMEPKYKNMLVQLFDRLELLCPPPLPAVPQQVSAVVPGSVIDKINGMARYAALNVDAFKTVPPAKLLSQCENRKWVTDQNPELEETCGKAFQYSKIIGRCDQNKVDTVAKLVHEGRAAVCTSFAATSASLLISGQAQGNYRVELISGPNHCFCLVNRDDRGMLDREKGTAGAPVMPGHEFWGDNVIIVDAWAGALGHPVFYWGTDGFPKVLRVYLTAHLLQHYDSAV